MPRTLTSTPESASALVSEAVDPTGLFPGADTFPGADVFPGRGGELVVTPATPRTLTETPA